MMVVAWRSDMGGDVCSRGSGRQTQGVEWQRRWRTDRLLWTKNTDAEAQQRRPEAGRALNGGRCSFEGRAGGQCNEGTRKRRRLGSG